MTSYLCKTKQNKMSREEIQRVLDNITILDNQNPLWRRMDMECDEKENRDKFSHNISKGDVSESSE